MLVLDGHKSAVYALAFSPDGGRLASGDRDGTVLLWEGGEPRRLATTYPKDAHAAVNALVFAPGELLVGGQFHWFGVPPEQVVEPGPPWWEVTGLALLTPTTAAIGGGNRAKPEGGRFELVDLPSRKVKPVGFSAPQGVRSISAVGERVAWSEWGRLLYVWDIRKPDRVKFPLAAEAPCVALSPDGLQLAAGVDRKVKLFDIERKQERRSLDGHTGRVTGVAFTPDGGTVVSGSWDGTVRLWDASSGAQRAAYTWPVGRVTSLAVSPDGLRLAVGGDTGAVVLADLY